MNIDEYNAENVVVIGEVATPGRYPILTAHKLKDILAMSGGLTAIAGNEIVLHRANQPTGVFAAIHDNGGLSDPIAMDVDINFAIEFWSRRLELSTCWELSTGPAVT